MPTAFAWLQATVSGKRCGCLRGSSIFGLLNNPQKDIEVYFDREILTEKILTFHPNINTKTIFVATQDVLAFVESLGFDIHIVDLP